MARRTGSGPASSFSRSVMPARNSLSRNGAPSWVPMSWMARMLGWFSAAMVRTSCSKRRSRLRLHQRLRQHVHGDIASEPGKTAALIPHPWSNHNPRHRRPPGQARAVRGASERGHQDRTGTVLLRSRLGHCDRYRVGGRWRPVICEIKSSAQVAYCNYVQAFGKRNLLGEDWVAAVPDGQELLAPEQPW